MRALILAGLLAVPAAAASADWMDREVGRRISRAHLSCDEAASGRTGPTLDCNGQEFDLQDARLNRTYRRIMSTLPRAQRERLRASERAWIRKRDIACWNRAVRDDGGGGTMATLLTSACILSQTIRRTIRLERFAAGKATLADLATDLPNERRLPVRRD